MRQKEIHRKGAENAKLFDFLIFAIFASLRWSLSYSCRSATMGSTRTARRAGR